MGVEKRTIDFHTQNIHDFLGVKTLIAALYVMARKKEYMEQRKKLTYIDIQEEQSKPAITLTETEKKVLGYLVETTLTPREVANICQISASTIRFHKVNLYGKLGVHNRVELIRKAVGLGLVENPYKPQGHVPN